MTTDRMVNNALRQRQEAVKAIRDKYPDDCANYLTRCQNCLYWHWTDITKDGQCVHGLAPVTSKNEPCPYYLLYN